MTLNQHTQRGLKELGFYAGEIDGVMGPLTQAAAAKLYAKLAYIFPMKKYEFHNSYNLVAVRMSDGYTNEFTDWGIIQHGETCTLFPMSTKPGFSYVKNKTYVDGVKGCAVLVEGQYKNMWTAGVGTWTGLPYLQQISPVNIYRDIDMDDEIDRGTIYPGMFGINFHSWKGFLIGLVQNLSAGCQVMQADVHDEIWPYITQMAKSGAITYTLLHINDFK